MKLNAAKWRKRRGMAKLLDALGAAEGLTRFVGGAVRDDLLGLPVSDIDLATRIRPQDVVERLEGAGIKAVPTGIDHGTITAVSDGQVVEVTSLRRDVATDGRRATIAYTDDWQEDAARRDFTINALLADPNDGTIVDYFGGLSDLEERHIRFIGDPLARIAEDHLRILRFFRFHARYGRGEPDAEALAACTARANDLMALSRERIADEMLKLLALPDPSSTVRSMLERNILRPVMPEIPPESVASLKALVGAEQEAEIPPDALRRLSALLPADPTAAAKVGTRLRLSNKARKRLTIAADRDLSTSPEALAYWLGTQGAVDRLLLCGEPAAAARVRDWHPPRLPIGGARLMAGGLPEGPVIARALRAIEKKWVESGFPSGDAFDAIVADCLAAAR
ncbi:MAG TPA: CCA tRNA nucleotidyltransferase [Sphingomicrobium sp.]|nr:CCA tRNA nucleotidyltransferase [Sphingomicrobium sp.]